MTFAGNGVVTLEARRALGGDRPRLIGIGAQLRW